METKHLKWLWPLLLLPLFRQEAVGQTKAAGDTVVLSDTLRWTWTAKAGEEKEFTFAVKTPGLYRVCWGDGDMTDEMYGEHGYSRFHRYVQEGSYEVMVFGIGSFPGKYTENAMGISMDMIYVKGGTFSMGATEEQGSDAYYTEKPVHSVTLSDYYIGQFEVTQAQWTAVMGTNPCKSSYGLGDDYPVYNVSWREAVEFCERLSAKTGRKYRLPTEAEWEYAARGGQNADGTKYAGSNTIGDVAWYTSNSSGKSHPVGQKQPNGLGIYDMSGNVFEWCSDWYDSDYYSSSPATNPQGPSSGSDRVGRSGCWLNDAEGCRVSCRGAAAPDRGYSHLGFRVAVLL